MYVQAQGRMKFVRPLYRELFASPIGRQTAIDTFAEWKVTLQYARVVKCTCSLFFLWALIL
jgi:hypothetical protein